MADLQVDVLSTGAVRLGGNLVCDGFAEGSSFRVQTHLHDDHMGEFDRSLGLQDFYMSPETFDLLIAERNAGIDIRSNIHAVARGTTQLLPDGSQLTLLPSAHMLGACQVAVDLPDGSSLGYSGDFSWPLDSTIKVDELVVDSTYGSPGSVRQYTQGEAEQALIEIVCTRLRHGSVHIKAHRGTIQRVIHVLGGNVGVPILGSNRLLREVEVYRRHGFAVEDVQSLESSSGRAALKERSYVRLYSKGDGWDSERLEGSTVTISAYMADRKHPLTIYSDRAFKVALSNHADFEGTLAYVSATGAQRVVTDNTRNHGVELACEISRRLGVDARASSNQEGPRWR